MRSTPDRAPDEIDLELLALGELSGDDRVRAAAAARGPLRREAEAIEDALTSWRAAHPPLPVARAPWFSSTWAAPMAFAAALLLTFLVLAPDRRVGEVRAMGGLPVDVQVTRSSDGQVSPGDRFLIRVRVPASGRLAVYTLDEEGEVALLDLADVVREQTYVLPGAAQLDGYTGREWLVVELHDPAADAASLEVSARGLLPDPGLHGGATRWVLDVTRGAR